MQRDFSLTVKRGSAEMHLVLLFGLSASMFGFQEMLDLTGTPAAGLWQRVWRGSSEHLSLVRFLIWTVTEECFLFQMWCSLIYSGSSWQS